MTTNKQEDFERISDRRKYLMFESANCAMCAAYLEFKERALDFSVLHIVLNVSKVKTSYMHIWRGVGKRFAMHIRAIVCAVYI